VALSPETRSLINSANAYQKWAHCPDRTAATAPAREAAERRFERLVDPEGKLPPEERAKRAEAGPARSRTPASSAGTSPPCRPRARGRAWTP